MFQQRLKKHYRHYRLRDSKLAERGSASGPLEKLKKNKSKVDYEPRSAHGRVVKSKLRVEHEPRSAHGRAVN